MEVSLSAPSSLPETYSAQKAFTGFAKCLSYCPGISYTTLQHAVLPMEHALHAVVVVMGQSDSLQEVS